MFEVFLSYAHEDGSRCDIVEDVLQRLLPSCVYRDIRVMAGGYDWVTQVERVLTQSNVVPVVVLIASEASARSDAVRRELALAAERGLVVIPVELDPGACSAFGLPSTIHRIDGTRSVAALERELLVALTEPVRRRLDVLRHNAFEWAKSLTIERSFWRSDDQRRVFDPDAPRGRALIAHGGSGKSVLIASTLRALEQRPGIYPVVVTPESLNDQDMAKLLASLGVHDPSWLASCVGGWRNAACTRQQELRLLFVVDGLDRVSPRDPSVARWLKLLSDAAPTLVGCRPEVWDDFYATRVSIEALPVEPLDVVRVKEILLAEHLPFAQQTSTPLLCVPLFLDIALELGKSWGSAPTTQSAFLSAAVDAVVAEPVPRAVPYRELLDKLARIQLRDLRFEVDIADVLDGEGNRLDVALDQLRKTGLLAFRSGRDGTTRLRLRHDLLDAYVVARLLTDADDAPQLRAALTARLSIGCGWSFSSMLLRVAHETGCRDVCDEVFRDYLRILDRKPDTEDRARQNPTDMDRAWAVTFALRSAIDCALPTVLRALRICSLPQPAPNGPISGSSLSDGEQRITQVAASTLASALAGISRGTAEQASQVVPVLEAVLANRAWKLRKRVVEGLGRFQNFELARKALVRFAHEELERPTGRDLAVLDSVVRAIDGRTDDDAVDLLERIALDPDVHREEPRVQRVAARLLRRRGGRAVGEAPMTVEEIVAGLKPWASASEYTDWRVVQEYAELVSSRVRNGVGPNGPEVLEALCGALDHVQTFARCPVAEALGEFGELRALDALAMELNEHEVPVEVWRSCVVGLTRQLVADSDPRTRQVRKARMLELARIARIRGDGELEQTLIDSALGSAASRGGDWYIDENVVEAWPRFGPGAELRCVRSDQPGHIDPRVEALIYEDDRRSAGPAHETKYRLVSIIAESDQRFRCEFQAIDWPTARGFHRALRDRRREFAGSSERPWIVPPPLGTSASPSIAVVHVAVVCAGCTLLLARRSASVVYWPGAWSASFEEQVTTQDFADEHALENAARRGFKEEFGEWPVGEVRVLACIHELDLQNPAFVVLLRTPATAQQILDDRRGPAAPPHGHEVARLHSIPFDEAEFVRFEKRNGEVRTLHPTARARVRIALSSGRAFA